MVVLAGTVLATPGSLFGPPTTLSRGTLSERVNFNTGEIKFRTKDSVDFVTQNIVIKGGGSSGWHAHPGVVLVTVASGNLLRYDNRCRATAYGPNSAFVESGHHAGLVRNASATADAVVYVTFIVPPETTASELRIDKRNPGCPQT
jgi:quercetin dioxygenase-like cupin family protein